MKKEFIVHIGLNKTGTTTIQQMMYQNAQALLNHGIYYPTINNDHGRFLRSMFMKNPKKQPANIKSGYCTIRKIKRLNNKFKSTLEENIKNPAIKKVIFSAEVLSILSGEELDNFANWISKFAYKTTILCCTRHPINWYNSLVQQNLKYRTLSVEKKCRSICENSSNQIHKRIKEYIRCFGGKNVIVYDFDKHKHRLCEKFIENCNFDHAVTQMLLTKPIEAQNESLSQEASLLINKLNTIKPLHENSNFAPVEVEQFRKIKGQKFKLPKKLLEQILISKSEAFKWLAENYPHECEDYANWPAQLKHYKENDGLFKQDTIDSLALLIADLVNENLQLKSGKE